MKIGTRLTLALLLCLMPVLAAYMYWSVKRSTRAYLEDLRGASHAATDALAHGVEDDLQASHWDQIRQLFEQVKTTGTSSALLGKDGKLWFALPDFPRELIPPAEAKLREPQPVDFEPAAAGRKWFCELDPIRGPDRRVIGYLLVASDWSAIGDDLRNRTIGSIVAALGVLAIVSAVIPVVVRRYVSQPLGQLSAKVTEFSSEDGADRTRPGGEVELITEEFRRLDRQLTQARSDLTERHRRELELERRLQRADRLATIGTLAAGLAHEIGTPMGVIRGRAQQLLAKEAPHTKAAEALEIIIAQIDRVSGIVRTLLDYARPRDLRRIACDIRPLAERTLRLVETEARQRNVALVTELGDAPLFVECDPDQIEQVFVNLAMNALDAMSAGGGTLRIAAAAEAGADANRASISFHDTGPGIPAQHRARVFDAFFTTKEPGRGTGMGLAVSLSIVHDHKGDITLESDATGTTFTVTMPLAQARSGRAKPAAVSA